MSLEVKPNSEVDWMNRFILGDSRSGEVAVRIDTTIPKLSGLDSLDRLTRAREETIERLRGSEPRLSPMRTAD